ncbi:MAG: hypothetical protein QOF78_1618 [Phycisphaerales bacterium]|jgi:hypothetical protein|nr:hypothetical protein [Phycisphaerales bacterium]
MRDALYWLAIVQAVYFVITGIWPIVHLRSFMAVTGLKIDWWLVKTVGALVTVIGLAIGIAAMRGQVGVEIFVLAAGSAAALGAVDIIYVAKRVIPKIYLADAVAEAVLIAGWILLCRV